MPGGQNRIDLTPAQRREIETLAAVLSQDQIADYFGMSRSAFQSILKRDDEAQRLYKKGRARAIFDVATGLLAKARGGDTGSICFFLKTQAGWRETQHVDHSSTDGSMAFPTQILLVAPDLQKQEQKDGK